MFLDEVLMLSYHDMYKIRVQLSKAQNWPTIPFGGMNFFLAGDFTQLQLMVEKQVHYMVAALALKHFWT